MNSHLAPYVSIVLTGRNDNFGGDFNDRLCAAVAYNHRLLTDFRVDYELIFVEWRPVAGRPLLADLLRERVAEVSPRLTTYEVDVRYHEAFSQNPRIQFHEFIAKNVGIRHTTGSFVLATNTDIYLSRGVVNLLARRALTPMVLYRATRVDLASQRDCTNVDDGTLSDPRNQLAIHVLEPPFLTDSSGDFLLLDRFSFHNLRGFNEVFRAATLHIDANFCYRARAQGLLLTDTGLNVFHVGEGTFDAQRAAYRDHPHDAPWGADWCKQILYENPPNWGLGDAPVVSVGPQRFRLEWDTRAVPPLVALRGVRAPGFASGSVRVLP